MPDALTLSTAAAMLVAALGTGLHCAAMCGPLRVLCGGSTKARIAYHGGRGLSYLALGAWAGLVGGSVSPVWLLAAVGLFMAGNAMGMPARWGEARAALLTRASAHPFLLGASSALLPCGLLHGWVVVAVAAGSPLRGGAILSALWLGSLPALELGTWALARPLAQARQRFPRATPRLLFLLALAPVVWRAHAAWSPAPMACHGMSHSVPGR